MFRRLNLFAGPGAGKSTLSAYIYSELKQRGRLVELVREYVKDWAYEGKKIRRWDQFYIFAKQLYRESRLLESGVDLIVSDSPLLLNAFYAHEGHYPAADAILDTAMAFEREHPSINLFTDRAGRTFQRSGRYQDEAESQDIDRKILWWLKDLGIDPLRVTTTQPQVALSVLLQHGLCDTPELGIET